MRLREAFQNLAQGILDDKAERFREQSGQQLSGLLDPFKLQLKEFRETVEQRHASDQRERGMLAQEIQSLRQLNQRISEDALNLTRALKGDTRAQGAWGELVLERVLGDLEHDVAEHLDEAPVTVVRKSAVVRPPLDRLDGRIVQPEIEDRVHHSRHRKLRA